MTRSRDVANIDGILTATGDMFVASAAATPARLGIGSTGQVLTVAGGTASWATPAGGGGMTSIASGNVPTDASTFTISSIPSTYKSLRLVLRGLCNASATAELCMRYNSSASGLYYAIASTATGLSNAADFTEFQIQYRPVASSTTGNIVIDIPDYSQTVSSKTANCLMIYQDSATPSYAVRNIRGVWRSNSAISSITIFDSGAYNFSNGSYILYGVS